MPLRSRKTRDGGVITAPIPKLVINRTGGMTGFNSRASRLSPAEKKRIALQAARCRWSSKD